MDVVEAKDIDERYHFSLFGFIFHPPPLIIPLSGHDVESTPNAGTKGGQYWAVFTANVCSPGSGLEISTGKDRRKCNGIQLPPLTPF